MAEKRELYKIDIQPENITEGINTGRVILYGHYVEGPYKVEIKGDSLFINGVRAFPQLMPKLFKEKCDSIREDRKNSKKTKQELESYMDSQYIIFRKLLKEKSYEIARDSILKALKKGKDVIDVAIASEGKGVVTYVVTSPLMTFNIFPNRNVKGFIPFYYPYEKTREEIEGDSIWKAICEKRDCLETKTNEIIEALKKGEVIEIYVSSSYFYNKKPFKNYQILDDRTLAELIYRVENNKLKLQYDNHLTLLANYNASEWPSLNTILRAAFGESRFNKMTTEQMIMDLLPISEQE